MIKHLLKKVAKSEKVAQTITQLYQQPAKQKVFGNKQLPSNGWEVEIDILYLTNDDGFKYVVNIIDCYNSLCGGKPLKSMDMTNVCRAINDVFENSKYLLTPKHITAGNEFNNAVFKQWCDDLHIKYSIAEPYEHRQLSYVERLNRTIGTWVMQLQNSIEVQTGKVNTKWREYYPEMIEILNKKNMKRLDGDYHKKKKEKLDNNIKLSNTNDTLIAPNTEVRVKINPEMPVDIHGNKLHGKVRAGDVKWVNKPTYTVVEPVLMPNNPPMYEIKNNNSKRTVNHLYSRENLQVIH